MEGVKMATIILVIIMALLPGWAMSATPTPIQLPAGGDCSGHNSNFCADGLTCESNVCKVLVGGTCLNAGDCVTGLTCQTVCMLNAGQNCSGPNAAHCLSWLRCDNDICKLHVGGDCSGPNAAYCATGLTCESDVCRSHAGHFCYGPVSANCATGLRCENNFCKLYAGGDCSGPNFHNCGYGLECQSDVCKLNAGLDCSGPNSANCATGLTCESNVCKLYLGGNCSAPNAANCAQGLTCDNDVCRLPVGAACSGPNYSNYCVTGLTCEYNVCKLTAGGDCSGAHSTYCATGMRCENDVCSIEAGHNCSHSYQCTGNSSCAYDQSHGGYICVCPADFYSLGGRCVSRFKVGHTCNSTEQCTNHSSCEYDHSYGENICVCNPTYYSIRSHCEPRIMAGGYCDVGATLDNPCTENALCYQSSCRCLPHFYSYGSVCIPLPTSTTKTTLWTTKTSTTPSTTTTRPRPSTTPATTPATTTTTWWTTLTTTTPPTSNAATSWLTTVPFWMSLTTTTSRDFHWAYTPQDYERLVVCAGHEITIPWRYTLGEGEQVEDVTWFRVPEGGVSEDIALFGRGHFLAMPAYSGRVHWTGEGGIVLSGATVGDSGRYTVVVTVVSPSKNSFSKYQRTVLVQVAEPPQTYDGQLHVSQSGQAVKNNVTGEWSIQLTCGHFYTRGHPHVDVEWTTPDGYSILSSNYSGGEFTLLLPSPPTGGNYSCRLLPNEPAPSCLPYYSPLLEVATVEVNEVKAGFSILSAEQGEVRHQLQELKEENRLLRQGVQSCGCLTGRP